MNCQKLESLLHKVFSAAQLDLTIPDRFGHMVKPREWFVIPLQVKRRLDTEKNARTAKPLARATVHSTLSALREFFLWLAMQPGYKSKIAYADADSFNLSEKDVRIAKATREKRVPTVDQVHHVLATMPAGTDIENATGR